MWRDITLLEITVSSVDTIFCVSNFIPSLQSNVKNKKTTKVT